MVETPDFKQIQTDANGAKVSLDTFTESMSRSVGAFKSIAEFVPQASKAFVDLGTQLKKISIDQRENILLGQQQSVLFGLMSAGVLGASKSFAQFDQQLKSDGLYTFSGQINEMVETAKRAASPVQALGDIAGTLGIKTFRQVGESIGAFTSRLKDTILAYAESADAALKLQTGFLHMSAASGEFNKVMEASGPNLKNINNLLFNQSAVITNAAQATNTETRSVVEYYNELGKIPGYLNAQINATDASEKRMNMLTAAIKLAHGTGQDFGVVLKDLDRAFNDYNASGAKALEFTGRIAELSQKYNIQIDDTRRFMDNMADSFKFVGENVESSSKIFNRFFQGLRESGLSTQATVDILNNMTDSLSKMSIAQKAFLSARTGGPGGLLGAVQIEKDLRDGRADEVMKRVEQTLKQQFGRIVTQQEGATSQGAAQQFVRQRMFLQQGPFGALTGGDEQKATRLLEALAKPGGYDAKRANEILHEDLKRGTALEDKTRTQLSQSNIHLESIKMFSGITALAVSQRAFTGATNNPELQRELRGNVVNALNRGREATTETGKQQQDDKSVLYYTRAARDLGKTIETLGLSMGSAGNAAEEAIIGRTRAHQDHDRAIQATRRSSAVGQATTTSLTTASQSQKQTNGTETTNRHAAHQAPTPQHITVKIDSVCPDCHKKFVSAQQLQSGSISNAPNMGPIGSFSAGF